jgi:hypothetical protein
VEPSITVFVLFSQLIQFCLGSLKLLLFGFLSTLEPVRRAVLARCIGQCSLKVGLDLCEPTLEIGNGLLL